MTDTLYQAQEYSSMTAMVARVKVKAGTPTPPVRVDPLRNLAAHFASLLLNRRNIPLHAIEQVEREIHQVGSRMVPYLLPLLDRQWDAIVAPHLEGAIASLAPGALDQLLDVLANPAASCAQRTEIARILGHTDTDRPRVTQVLLKVMRDPGDEPHVREACVLALEQSPTHDVLDALQETRANDPNPYVREAAAEVLEYLDEP